MSFRTRNVGVGLLVITTNLLGLIQLANLNSLRAVVADSDDDEVLPLAERIRRRDRVDDKSQTEDDDVDDADDSDEADLDESFDPRSDLD